MVQWFSASRRRRESSRVKFASDSPLEGSGVEPLVPRYKSPRFPKHSGHRGAGSGTGEGDVGGGLRRRRHLRARVLENFAPDDAMRRTRRAAALPKVICGPR